MSSPFRRSVLISANVAMALALVGAYVTHESRVSQLAASDASMSLQERLPVLVVVTGDSPTDAAVGGAVAEAQGGALLAVPVTGLTGAMITGLSRSTLDRVLILGGPAAVTEATTSALGQYTRGAVTRLFGPDRFTTAVKVATSQFPRPVLQVRIMSGDPSAVGPPAVDQAASATPVLLVGRDSIPASVAAALARMRPFQIEVMGGPSAVSEAVVEQLQRYTVLRVVRADAEGSDEA